MISYCRPKEGQSFFEFLLALPEGRRFLAAANPPRWACSSDVRALAAESHRLRYSDTRGMLHYARLACCLAGTVRWKDADHQDAKLEVSIQEANVCRIVGQFREAKKLFGIAKEISNKTRRPDLKALLWERRAALYRDLGRFSVAEECLKKAADQRMRGDRRSDLNACLISRALCAGYAGNSRKAVRLSEQAAKRIDPGEEPETALATIIALSWHLADCGDPAEARACLVAGEYLFDSYKDDLIHAHVLWSRAHVDNALRLHLSASFLYQRVSEIFARQGLVLNRALVLLDLCGSLAVMKQWKEVARVAREILPDFEKLGLPRESARTRRYLLAAS
jgi:tetratricopeptide (TPR) repeat protein